MDNQLRVCPVVSGALLVRCWCHSPSHHTHKPLTNMHKGLMPQLPVSALNELTTWLSWRTVYRNKCHDVQKAERSHMTSLRWPNFRFETSPFSSWILQPLCLTDRHYRERLLCWSTRPESTVREDMKGVIEVGADIHTSSVSMCLFYFFIVQVWYKSSAENRVQAERSSTRHSVPETEGDITAWGPTPSSHFSTLHIARLKVSPISGWCTMSSLCRCPYLWLILAQNNTPIASVRRGGRPSGEAPPVPQDHLS